MANVFGALNRFISRLDSDLPPQPQSSSLASGFQVLKNRDDRLAIEPWFDFIIGINGRNIDNPDHNLFSTEVQNCAGRSVSLGVYSTKGQQIREVHVQVPAEKPSLGLALQWCPLAVTEDVWHILDVTPNSPADVAGLIPYSDYVVGSPEGLMRGDGGLAELVEDFMNRTLRLYVYNNEFDVTRVVSITPARGWGGDGALGCVLGFGALHRVPAALTEPVQGPGETLFDSAGTDSYSPAPVNGVSPPEQSPPATMSAALFTPADMTNATPSAMTGPPPARTTKTGRKAKPVSSASAFDDYLKEGEEISKQLDRATTPRSSGPVAPPPPKAGTAPPPVSSPVPADAVAGKDEKLTDDGTAG